MATADMTALPLQQFIASLDSASLPKILQVCSGVYFQGSVYEISGSEVCFSTGDLIKVIGIELQSVCCEDVKNSQTFELPITHTGLFKVVPEKMPYSSVEEMISLRPVGLDSCLSFAFTCQTDVKLEDYTVAAGTKLMVLYIDQQYGKEDKLCCRFQGQQDSTALVSIPLSVCGQFTECESEERFTLLDIFSSPFLQSQRFCMVNTTMSDRPLRLSPIYQVHALMNLRKNILKFPSSLEVDVVDVTDTCGDLNFTLPLTLTEVLSQPAECFPTVIKILEGPGSGSSFKSHWLPELTVNRHLVFHATQTSTMFLLSSLKSRKAQQYFLVSQEYGGKFRRRPREFNSVYELYVASMQMPGLQVTVTRNSEHVEEEGMPALNVGELLQVLRYDSKALPGKSSKDMNQTEDVLLCQRLQDPQDRDDDDDDQDDVQQEESREEIALPIFMQGHFVEMLTDNKKYSLRDLCGKHQPPLDVKLANRDPDLQADPLAGLTGIRVEGLTTEPTILAGFLNSPDSCFEIPANRIYLSVCFTTDPLPWPSDQPPNFCTETVTQVTDSLFYEFCKMLSSDEPPPPRPPKRNLTMTKACKKSTSKQQKKSFKAEKSKHCAEKGIPTKELADLTLNSKRRPPPPPPSPDMLDDTAPPLLPRKHEAAEKSHCKAKPNTYVKIKEIKELPTHVSVDLDSDHDYESVDETLVNVVRKAQENILYY